MGLFWTFNGNDLLTVILAGLLIPLEEITKFLIQKEFVSVR